MEKVMDCGKPLRCDLVSPLARHVTVTVRREAAHDACLSKRDLNHRSNDFHQAGYLLDSDSSVDQCI
jgi:hypothetical protein